MGNEKRNCWEYFKCGREKGGVNAAELGVCPAAADTSFTGINSGKRGGRFCWGVAGTLCKGKIQGTFAEKRVSCMGCPFYKLVQLEEGTANLRTKFLRFVIKPGGTPLLGELDLIKVSAGTRFLTQGDHIDASYIIQRGACIEIVEKDGTLHPANYRVEGDLVGITAIFTGEPQPVHVEAETDMELWTLPRERFEKIPAEDPELHVFLAELVAQRFDSMRPTAKVSIGKYVAEEIIGRGGYSIVYRGLHTDLKIPVAIKMMRHDMALDPGFITGFRKEAEIIASLNHESIIRVYDIEERFRTVFIVMEYVEGDSLWDFMKSGDGPLPLGFTVKLLLAAAKGLSYAHSRGIVHRDINPRNIILKKDGGIKIVDFGLSCPMGTEDLETLGSVYYAAPEQLEGEPMDQRTDIHALGIMAYEMVTGKKPFGENDLGKLMEMRLNREIPDPSKELPHLPGALSNLILKCSRRDPDERFPDMHEVIGALGNLSEGSIGNFFSMPGEKTLSRPLTLTYPPSREEELGRLFKEFNERIERLGASLEPDIPTIFTAPAREERLPRPVGTHGISHMGNVRKRNEDRFLIRDLSNETLLLAVADGMGGEARGDLASSMVVKKLRETAAPVKDPAGLFVGEITGLDRALSAMGEEDPGLEGMGTTLTGCLVERGTAHWFHVGDSRLHLLREGVLTQVTEDQNMVQFLIDEKQITRQEARTHPARHFLDQCVGCGHCEPQTGSFSLVEGDILLLSSDGLHEDLSPKALTALLCSDSHIEVKAGALIQGALRGGGNDNITVVVAEIRRLNGGP